MAWQRRVREERAITDRDNLFGAWWEDLDTDIKKATVRAIDQSTATSLIEQYEWMGRMPAIVSHCFGIYFDGALGGCVVYSPEYGENLGIWDRYGWTGKIVLLSRGACVHWAHPHAASKLIASSMRMLPAHLEVVTATVDDLAGEVGTIYQACNFTYIGRMRADNPRSSGSWPEREGILIDGQLYTGRTLRHRLGTQDRAAVLRAYPNAQFVTQQAKGRYVYFRKNRKRHLATIADLVQAYPKRESARPPAQGVATPGVAGQVYDPFEDVPLRSIA